MSKITVGLEVTDQLCADVMCTALEGGIGYWAQADKIEKAGDEYKSCLLAELNDDESGYQWDKPMTLNYDVIREGMRRLLSGEVKGPDDIRDWILTDIVNNESVNIDADAADCIVQAGLLGEIRYG